MAVAGKGGAAPASPGGNPYTADQGNPLGQFPYFFHRLAWLVMGRRMDLEIMRTPRPGIIRRWLVGKGDLTAAGAPFSWTRDSFDSPGSRLALATSPIRYLISDDRPAWEGGNQLSNPDARAVVAFQRHAGDPPLIRAGQAQGRPTIRNRLTSFGSRVPPLNPGYSSEDVTGGSG